MIWSVDLSLLDYTSILPTFMDGLRESRHPFIFIVRTGLLDLLNAPGAAQKVLDLLPAILGPLRAGLANKDKDLFLGSLKICNRLIALLGPLLMSHLNALLPPIASRVLSSDAEIREHVQYALSECHAHCGQGALKIIRSRVPTFTPCFNS